MGDITATEAIDTLGISRSGNYRLVRQIEKSRQLIRPSVFFLFADRYFQNRELIFKNLSLIVGIGIMVGESNG